MSKKLVIYLLSYRRPEYISEAIDSILAQSYTDFDFVISENSPDNSVDSVISTYQSKNVSVLKRSPSLSAADHFKLILTEAKCYEYAMLFHDDDILNADAITKMMAEISGLPTASAVACNAIIIKDHLKTDSLLIPGLRNKIEIRSASALINRYVFRSLGHPPFPSYIYRTALMNPEMLNTIDGGKYSDVSFLIKLVQKGLFVWLPEPLMNYRIHLSNDSALVNLADIKKISLFFFKTCPWLLPQISFYFLKQLIKRILF